jgi:hypothetical protein
VTSFDVVAFTRDYETWLGSRIPLVSRDLEAKHAAMAGSAFRFLRGTYYLWLRRVADLVPDLLHHPAVPLIGDLHVENFGTWLDHDGTRRWGVNDLDELSLGSYRLDLARLATSALLAPGINIDIVPLCRLLLSHWQHATPGAAVAVDTDEARHLRALMPAPKPAKDYYAALRTGRPAELLTGRSAELLTGRSAELLTGRSAETVVGRLGETVTGRLGETVTGRPSEVVIGSGGRSVDTPAVSGDESGDMPVGSGGEPVGTASVPDAVRAALHATVGPDWQPVWYARQAGTGSLGHPRFAAVARDAAGHWQAREAKLLGPPTCAWPRVDVGLTVDDKLYGTVLDRVRGPYPSRRVEGWQLRRLAPDIVRVDLANLAVHDTERVLRSMAQTLVDVHGPRPDALADSGDHRWLVEAVTILAADTRACHRRWKG